MVTHRTSQQYTPAHPAWLMLPDCFQEIREEFSDLHCGAHVLVIAGKICPIGQDEHVVHQNGLVQSKPEFSIRSTWSKKSNQDIRKFR